MSDITREDLLPRLLKRLAFPSLEELFAAIGYGGMSAQKAVNRIRDELRTIDKTKKTDVPFEIRSDKKLKPIHGILVEGIDNVLIKFARCCTPVPGDESIGFITRGFGVSVHRKDCKNYLKSLEIPEESGRWVRVAWANSDADIYVTGLFITCRERSGIVVDVATVLNGLKIKMTSLAAKDLGDVTTVSIVIEVKNRDELNQAIARLSSVPGVVEIKRGDG
jgi:GTP pyrophosphokinase